MMATAQLKNRRVLRGSYQGKKTKMVVTHAVKSRRAEYHYTFEYLPDTTDKDLALHMRILCNMADEQDVVQDTYDTLLGQTITNAGLSAFVGSLSVHIEKPNECSTLLTFWVAERHQWVSHSWVGGTPSHLPSIAVIKQFILDFLLDMSKD